MSETFRFESGIDVPGHLVPTVDSFPVPLGPYFTHGDPVSRPGLVSLTEVMTGSEGPHPWGSTYSR